MFNYFKYDLDGLFDRFQYVYVFGDIHDNCRVLANYLLLNSICFDYTGSCINSELHNLRVKSNVFLIFLGDIIYKTKTQFKSIFRFLFDNISNSMLIVGNHEVKFLYQFWYLIENDILCSSTGTNIQIGKTNTPKNLEHVYNLMYKVKINAPTHFCPKRLSWNEYAINVAYRYRNEPEKYENLMIAVYILYWGIIMAYSKKWDLLLIHAGLKPATDLNKQRIKDICNIRTINGKPWYLLCSKDYKFPTFIIFGHWSSLCCQQSIQPFIFRNQYICLDTGCYETNILSVVKITVSNKTMDWFDMSVCYCKLKNSKIREDTLISTSTFTCRDSKFYTLEIK